MNSFVCRTREVCGDAKAFYVDQVGICIPIGSVAAYQDKQLEALDTIANFLTRHPPHLTEVFYPEVAHRPTHRIEPLPFHADQWKQHLRKLIGSGVGFISEWNLLPRSLPQLLPINYQAQVIHRGQSPEIPVLVEWTDSLVDEVVPSGRRTGFSNVWGFGTFGYVLPEKSRFQLEKWARLSSVSESDVSEFFSTVTLLFKVQRELDGILVLSHTLDTEAVCRRLTRT
jgi:hypothetical protein